MNIFYEWLQHLIAISVVGFLVIFLGGGLLDNAVNVSNWIKSIKAVVSDMGANKGFFGSAWVFILLSNGFLVVFTGFHNMFNQLGYEQIPILASLLGLLAWWVLGVVAIRKKRN